MDRKSLILLVIALLLLVTSVSVSYNRFINIKNFDSYYEEYEE